MEVQLSELYATNTVYATKEGFSLYKAETPGTFRIGTRVTTICKIAPPLNDEDVQERWGDPIAQITWLPFSKNKLQFRGTEIELREYLRPDGKFKYVACNQDVIFTH